MQSLPESAGIRIRSRVITLFLLVAGLYVAMAGRFAYLQLIPHGPAPETRDLRREKIQPRRGDIFDRNGVPLAVSVDGFDVAIRPNLIRAKGQPQRVITELSRRIGLNPQFVAAKLSLPRKFAWLRRGVSRDTGLGVDKLQLLGVEIHRCYLRTYPQGVLAAQVLGRLNNDGTGNAGVEKGYDKILAGAPGLREFRVDGRNEEIPGTGRVISRVRNGLSLRLTLDARIQQEAEQQLDASIQARHAKAGSTIVVDVPTGQILAIANRPTFNPNQPVKDVGDMLNRAIAYAYEPGSTMKMITAAGALSERTWSESETVVCSGSKLIGKRRIRCVIEPPYHGGHGVETLRDIIRNSCNVGAATVGMKLGGPRLYHYIKSFGLLERSHLGMPGAVVYRLSPPDKWAQMKLANVAFGQGVMVTPIQLVYAYAAIGNGGQRMTPQIIDATLDPNSGRTFRNPPKPGVRVVPPEIAQKVTGLLKAVVYDGTGKPAQVPGYSIVGKTGSAQKAGGHGYLPGKFVASFVGFAPASHPRVACLTMVDEPEGLHWGAVCAAPVVREVLRWSLQYLQVPPDAPDLVGDGAKPHSIWLQEHPEAREAAALKKAQRIVRQRHHSHHAAKAPSRETGESTPSPADDDPNPGRDRAPDHNLDGATGPAGHTYHREGHHGASTA